MPNESMLEADSAVFFEARIALQDERQEFITSIVEECKSVDFTNHTLIHLESKLTVLEKTWDDFNQQHDALLEKYPQLYISSDYCKNKVFRDTLTMYADARAHLLNKIEALRSVIPPSSSEARRVTPLSGLHLFEKIRFKPFSGKYEDWKEFEDMFQAMVGNNPDLQPVHKMSLLKNAMQGDAARLLANMRATNESYPIAWDLLVKRYENKRLLITTQLDKLFGSSSIIESNSKGLHELLNTLREALDSLDALGAKTDEWDMPLVYHIVRRLSSPIRKEWERTLGGNNDFPQLSTLQEFLQSEATTLESIEITSEKSMKLRPSTSISSQGSRHQKPVSSRSYASTAHAPAHSTQSHARSSSTAQALPRQDPQSSRTIKPWMKGVRGPDDPGHTCDCCGANHYISSCEQFRSMSPLKRHNLVINTRLCTNCLGRHDVQACRSKKLCWHCGIKHHTLIHLGDTTPAAQQAQPSALSTSSQKDAPAQ